ncbi:uncharacterized protein LOC129744941 isoform X2 [Uranotaenia lowii]|nr:uncharacterized protein LOC129744941 isoform X2 [Uranotaenia lowii]
MIRPHFEAQPPPMDFQQQQLQHQVVQQQQISKIVSSPPPTIVGTPNGTKMCVTKMIVGLDHSPMAFNLRQRIIGDGGTNLNYIRSETGALVSLRGRGSLVFEHQTGQEAPEPLHLLIEHPTLEGLQEAKQLVKNLIETLQEELNLFQENLAPKQNFQIIQQPTLVQTTQVPQMPMMNQHVTQPNGIMHQPPPVMPPQGFVQHQQSQPPPPQIMQQPPTIIQSHVPVQIHQQPNNVVISQIQTAPQITNVSNPPPGAQIRPPMVHIKNTVPPHMTQPPPSIQIQQPPEAPQQILVNQAPPYQVQYIQQNPTIQTSNGPHPGAGQVTIQHVIQQPQPQPIQGIVQTAMPPPQFEQFHQRPPPGQQIITVQGSGPFMVPPPNIIHQSIAPHPQNQIIVQSQPVINHPPPNTIPQEIVQTTIGPPMGQPTSMGPPTMTQVPILMNGVDDKKGGEIQIKTEQVKIEEVPPPGTIIQQIAKSTVIPVSSMPGISLSQPPPPIMSVPPPTVQHIVGNTIITSQPNPTMNHTIPQQIYSQIPVSIQSFQPPQQIQMNGGTHFVVNAPQHWPPNGHVPPPQIQQVPVSSMQNIQFAPQQIRQPEGIQIISTPTIISAAEYRPPPQHIITTSSFNPQMQPPPGVQVIHTVPPPTQQIITSIPQPAHTQQHIIEAPAHMGQQHQIITTAPGIPPPPPSFTTVQYAAAPPELKPPPAEMQMHSLSAQLTMRLGQKRKHTEDEAHSNVVQKIGMG